MSEAANVETVKKRSELAVILLEVMKAMESFMIADLRAAHAADCRDQDFGLAFHDARERLRADFAIEFIVNPKSPGLYFRANSKQKIARAATVRQKAYRAKERAVDILDAVDEAELSEHDRDMLARRKERYNFDLIRGAQLERLQREMPIGSGLPSIPRGDRR